MYIILVTACKFLSIIRILSSLLVIMNYEDQYTDRVFRSSGFEIGN